MLILRPDAEPSADWLGGRRLVAESEWREELHPRDRGRFAHKPGVPGGPDDSEPSGPDDAPEPPRPIYAKDSSQVSDRYHEWRTRNERANAELGRTEWPDPAPSYMTGADTPETREAALTNPGLGLLITPWTAHYADRTAPYSHLAVDNGVYTEFSTKGKKPFSREKFLGLLDRLNKNPEAAKKVLFAVAPDRVADWKGTVERSSPYYDEIHARGFPAAFAAQDGIEHHLDQIPWDKFEVLFIGGSTAWKLGYDTTGLTEKQRFAPTPKSMRGVKFNSQFIGLLREAERRGKKVHVGRVSSASRFDLSAYGLGADTMDGTFVLFGSRENTPKVVNWLRTYDPYDANARQHPAQDRPPGYVDPADVSPTDSQVLDTTTDRWNPNRAKQHVLPGLYEEPAPEDDEQEEPEPARDDQSPRNRLRQQLSDALRQHLGEHADKLLPELLRSNSGWAVSSMMEEEGIDAEHQQAAKAAWDAVWTGHRESVTGVKEKSAGDAEQSRADDEARWARIQERDRLEREAEKIQLQRFAEEHWKHPPPLLEVSPKEWAACQYRARLAQVDKDLVKLGEVADLAQIIVDHDKYSDDPWPAERLRPIQEEFDLKNEKKNFVTLRNRYRQHTEKGRGGVWEAFHGAQGEKEYLESRLKMGYFTANSNNSKLDPIREHAAAARAAMEAGQAVPDSLVEQYSYESWLPGRYREQLIGIERKKGWKQYLESGLREFGKKELAQALEAAGPKLDAVIKAPRPEIFKEISEAQARVDQLSEEQLRVANDLRDESTQAWAYTGADTWPADQYPEQAKRQSELFDLTVVKGNAVAQAIKQLNDTKQRLGREFLDSVLPADTARVRITKGEHLTDEGRDSVDRAARWLSHVVGSAHGNLTVNTKAPDPTSKYAHRAYATGAETMAVRPDVSVETVVHEFGHNLDHAVGLDRTSKAFAVEALVSSGQEIQHLGPGHEPEEFGNDDKFWGPNKSYCGKYYEGSNSNEVLSMGLQYLYQDPVGFYQGAPEHFRYTLAAIHGFI